MQTVGAEDFSPSAGMDVKFETKFLVDELVEASAQSVGDDERGDGSGVERRLGSIE